jgi:hypothetical protein
MGYSEPTPGNALWVTQDPHKHAKDINIEHKDFHSIFKSNKGGKR